jgi:hypothetical protein
VLAALIVVNLSVLVVAIALPLGWGVNTLLVGVLTFLQAVGAVYAVLETSKSIAKE